MSDYAIQRAFADVDPDNLPTEAAYLLGCLDFPVSQLRWRPPEYWPSWRLLRNIRREYRDLGRHRNMVEAVSRLTAARDARTRTEAHIALALYGRPVPVDSLLINIHHLPTKTMLLAVLGDSVGIGVAMGAFTAEEDSGSRLVYLDALYYQDTAEALAFIRKVAENPPDEEAGRRARWMLDHPFAPADAWKL